FVHVGGTTVWAELRGGCRGKGRDCATSGSLGREGGRRRRLQDGLSRVWAGRSGGQGSDRLGALHTSYRPRRGSALL
ncbi:Hypothetical predicted protein, partial [Marmota monax]